MQIIGKQSQHQTEGKSEILFSKKDEKNESFLITVNLVRVVHTGIIYCTKDVICTSKSCIPFYKQHYLTIITI